MSTTLTSKGQVTIPKAVRDHLGIRPGSKVTFTLAEDGKNIIILPEGRQLPLDRFDRLKGHAGPGPTTDDIMAMTRGED
jgi:antitoxin PrlF